MLKYRLLCSLLIWALCSPCPTFATVLAVFERGANGYIAAPPTFLSGDQNSWYSGNEMYVSFFKPQSGLWFGNLKCFTLPAEGLRGLTDPNGQIRANVYSKWSEWPDGNDYTKGGLAEVLSKQFGQGENRRQIFTYLENVAGTPSPRLNDYDNAFTRNNPKLTASLLGVSENYRDLLISQVRARNLGAVIHARPLRVDYPESNKWVIFLGDNSGFMHCFDGATGEERWAFIMPEHLNQLANAATPLKNSFVDNTPILYTTSNKQKILFYGLGRGGWSYVALDITDLENPGLLYFIKNTILEKPRLGLSYGNPTVTQIAGSVAASKYRRDPQKCIFRDEPLLYGNQHDVIILPGGYDVTAVSQGAASGRGMAVIGVDPLSGDLDPAFAMLNSEASPVMLNAVVDVTAVKAGDQGVVDGLYFGDLGGNLFYAMQYRPQKTGLTCADDYRRSAKPATEFKASSQFIPYKLFETGSNTNGKAAAAQKIMFKPAIVRVQDYYQIYFGTGDREHPSTTGTNDKFYCVKFNSWQDLTFDPAEPRHLTEADLLDITDNVLQEGNAPQQKLAAAELMRKKGWLLALSDGEKVVSGPVVYAGMVFFTTYTPAIKQNGFTQAPMAKLYALDHLSGGATPLWSGAVNKAVKLNSSHRYKIIGDHMPSAPEIRIFKDRVALYVAVDNKIIEEELPDKSLQTFYWREFY